MLESSESESGFITSINLNSKHIVYAGHFPGYPVTAGVIQLQIVHELLENKFGKKLKLITITGCKFLKVLNPDETPQIFVHIEVKKMGDFLDIKASGVNGGNIFFKLQSLYKFI